ncbi:hypothetical protein G7Z17_g13742 [Cylindrodendrum hubeiense]|uniref:Uncharacterized protein n=1 Tax=Cylindrodendrum hubeiense TaxID=595255 RepID=A0A9P5GT77_9HYPO|nr:hypothetical protein G7Z17_g13742 [Cylindrodendrum hubeiense]
MLVRSPVSTNSSEVVDGLSNTPRQITLRGYLQLASRVARHEAEAKTSSPTLHPGQSALQRIVAQSAERRPQSRRQTAGDGDGGPRLQQTDIPVKPGRVNSSSGWTVTRSPAQPLEQSEARCVYKIPDTGPKRDGNGPSWKAGGPTTSGAVGHALF